MTMLELKNIVLSRGKHKVLDGVNAEASAGRVIALLGENGTGKTTLLNCICGMLKCDSGEIFSGNKAVDPESDEWKEKISYVLDEGSAIPLLTVDEQLRLQCLLSGIGKSEASKRADHIISLLNLEKHRDYRAEELSAGLRKKLGIGLGLIRNAEIYLFDEPFSSLDVYSASDLSRLLGILKRRGRTVILSTHSRLSFPASAIRSGCWPTAGLPIIMNRRR